MTNSACKHFIAHIEGPNTGSFLFRQILFEIFWIETDA